MTLTIELPEDKVEAIRTMASNQSTTMQELLETAVDRILDRNTRIDAAGEYVQRKNAELYRRLA